MMYDVAIIAITIMCKCLYPSFLLQVGNHDNSCCILFPYHTPKIRNRVWNWTLSGNESLFQLVSL